MQQYKSVDEYIDSFPSDTKKLLRKIRTIIRRAAPDAEELISYGMPGYRQNGMLVWFAAYKHHLGFYPKGESAINAFKKQLIGYKLSTGTIQLPLNEPLPEQLIADIVSFRVKENAANILTKQQKSSKKTLRICSNGHRYYKSSECPVCPECEKSKMTEGFLSELSVPARRALENEKIMTLEKLSEYSEKEILMLHGIGKTSIPKLQAALKKQGLKFSK